MRPGFVFERQRRPGLDHVPLHVIGQHAEEDVRLDTAFGPMADRAHLQIDTFQCAECPLHFGQPLMVEHRLFGRHVGCLDAGADHIETVQRGFCCNTRLADRKAE